MTTPRKSSRPKADDTEGLRDWMIDMDHKLDTLLEWMEVSVAQQQRHAPFIDRMMKEEEDRDELYKSIRNKILASGLFSGLSVICAMLWFAITTWLGKGG